MRAALLLLLATFALAGCYVSKTLLTDPKQAVQPLAVGTYADPEDAGKAMDVSVDPDGWYRFYQIGDDSVERMLFTPLKGNDRILALAMKDRPNGYRYGLAYKADDGLVYFSIVSCGDEAARRAAIAHHAVIVKDSASCEFKSPADLQGALADYAKDWNWRDGAVSLPAAGAPIGP